MQNKGVNKVNQRFPVNENKRKEIQNKLKGRFINEAVFARIPRDDTSAGLSRPNVGCRGRAQTCD